MFYWRTEVQDRSAYTQPRQQAQLVPDVELATAGVSTVTIVSLVLGGMPCHVH